MAPLPGELIFVGGVHGAGKTRFCQLLSETVRANHYAASQFIPTNVPLSEKAVSDPRSNQRTIVQAVQKLRRKISRILLDGHFSLLTNDGGIERVPVEIFSELQPVALLLVEAPVDVVRSRLTERDDRVYPVDLLESLQRHEYSHAQAVSRSLAVPLMLVPSMSYSMQDVADFLVQYLRDSPEQK